jgi:hypothetical protein
MVYASAEGELLRSTDYGESWQQRSQLAAGSIAVDPANADHIAGLSSSGMVRSRDGGQSFDTIGLGLIQPTSFAVDWSRPSAVHIGTWAAPDAFIAKCDPAGEPVYGTYFGGSGAERGDAVAVAPDGSVWIAGYTESADLPVIGEVWSDPSAARTMFVARISPDGKALSFSTRFGATRELELVGGAWRAIAVDSAGNAVAAGSTSSPNLPVANALRDRLTGDTDAFVFKFAP